MILHVFRSLPRSRENSPLIFPFPCDLGARGAESEEVPARLRSGPDHSVSRS